MIQSTNRDFYGVTGGGGSDNDGTVFVLSNGLGPFVQARPGFGIAGRVVLILGNNLTGTTSVTFSGTAASFTVVSDTYIKATVPTGSTTGTIKVTTPSRPLSSNVPFVVPQANSCMNGEAAFRAGFFFKFSSEGWAENLCDGLRKIHSRIVRR